MSSAVDRSKLHWCTEEIPIGSKYFLEFGQSFTEARFLGSLQREGSWIGALPLIPTDRFDISRLQYLVPTLRYFNIKTFDLNEIEQELLTFSQYLLQPYHAFINLFTNFDFCDETEYIPFNNKYNTSLPLYTGKIINRRLINAIRELIINDKLDSLTICEDVSRTGIGLRCLYPKQYNSVQHRFVIRATVSFTYPGNYILENDAFDILLQDETWSQYVHNIQTKLIDKELIPTQQEKLWTQLLIDPNSAQSASSSDESDADIDYKMRRISDYDQHRQKIKNKKYFTPFIIYDFSQNRYSSNDNNFNYNDIVSAISHSSTQAAKCANMQRAFTNKISQCQVFMVLSKNDYDTKPTAYVYRLNILKTKDINLYIKQLNQNEQEHKQNEEECMSTATLIVHIIRSNIDEFHKEILVSKYFTATNFIDTTVQILEFLKLKQQTFAASISERNNILLLQERAIIVLADVVWHFYKRYYKQFLQWVKTKNINSIISQYVSCKEENITQLCQQMRSLINTVPARNDDLKQYYTFLEPFLKAANEKELQDFNECASILLKKHRNFMSLTDIKYADINVTYSTSSGMRVGISSANASDNWTNSKLNGGVTINMSINLDSISTTPVSAKVCIIPNNVIQLSTMHTMCGDVREDKITFNKDNIAEFLKINDNKDVFRMLKYALIFVGIVQDPLSESKSINYESILNDIWLFTGGHGLALSVVNLGPSRSGFASSSAVACNLLKVLYACSGNDIAVNDELLGSMALLLENRLGLKSGRQDVDGLLPNGVKVLHYNTTTQFVSPVITYLSADRFNVNELGSKMILVNSGISRAAGLGLHRGLNMRFLAYLSRDPVRFKSILQSYMIHEEIIAALQFNNYCFLGKLFLDYMSCRERIDPGATQSKFDVDNKNEKILRRLFDPLVDMKLIYGGMFTGAMGGGVAMLSVTPYASETNKINKNQTNIQYALDNLKKWKTDKGSIPFERLSVIKYSVNVDGIKLIQTKCDVEVKIDDNKEDGDNIIKIIKNEYLFKSMNEKHMICFDDNFTEIILPLNELNIDKIQKIKQITDKASVDRKDVNIVVIQTHTKNNKITCKISHAKLI